METFTIFLLILTLICWGLWGFFSKLGVTTIGVYQFILVYQIVTIVLVFVYLLLTHNVVLTPSKNLIYPILAGIFTAVGIITEYLFIEKVQISIAIPLVALYPAITIILAVLILKETLTLYQGLGIILALTAGVLLGL